jgi:hypothetical protein|tara:strand:- start:371 stop:1222 length:852 start_codon:yes stop_codon:yes gene_type:complete
MIIVDYSGICLASIIVNKELNEGMVRHMTLNTLRMYNQKFKKDYGEMILACDGMNNWRRGHYPEYKANRKKNRDKSDFDWNEAFRIMHLIKDEIRENFPYKVIHLEGCEADDIIGTLVERTQEFGNLEDVMIVSSDGDFKQLQKYDNVKQFSPLKKAQVVDDNPRLNLLIKILKGDSGDGVPNVLSDDKTFTEGRRQTPLSKKKMDAIIQDIGEGELLYAASWYRNYCRNKVLIDLTETPINLKKEIINNFEEQDPWKNKSKVFPYLVSKKMNQLIESVQEFI